MAAHSHGRAFGPHDERVLATLADHLAVALARVRLADEQARVAQALQETLLPPLLPRLPGAEVAARYRPTGAGNVVGGDFYDLFECGDRAWALLIGDVSGVGPEAAALTGIARYTARAVAGDSVAPSSVLDAINRALANQRTEDRFCTAVHATLRPGEGCIDVTLACGGHPPPLVLRDDGRVERLDRSPGVLLGPFAGAWFEDEEVRLAPGDALVLYTDGVTEARAPDRTLFGTTRLERVLAACAGRTADGIARRVELAADDFSAGAAADDMAVVVVRAMPAA
jgi:serine phosphatase RsbU (regulator of sigma subunit)